MSLQYIIDGYNISKHASFAPSTRNKDTGICLAEFIRSNKLCGSYKNRVLIVFDGYPGSNEQRAEYDRIEFMYSGAKSADDAIKQLVESSANPKNIIVVSDDKEICFAVRPAGAHPLGVEEFICNKKRAKEPNRQADASKPNLTYSQMDKINKELRQIWLK